MTKVSVLLLIAFIALIFGGCGLFLVNDTQALTSRMDASYKVYTNQSVHIDKRAHSLINYFQTLEKVKQRYPDVYKRYKDQLNPEIEFGKIEKHYKTKVPGVFAIPAWEQYMGLIPSVFNYQTHGYYLACRVVNATKRYIRAVQIYVAVFDHFDKPIGVSEINSGFTYGSIGPYNENTFIHNSTIKTDKWFSDIIPQNVGRMVFYVNQVVFE